MCGLEMGVGFVYGYRGLIGLMVIVDAWEESYSKQKLHETTASTPTVLLLT